MAFETLTRELRRLSWRSAALVALAALIVGWVLSGPLSGTLSGLIGADNESSTPAARDLWRVAVTPGPEYDAGQPVAASDLPGGASSHSALLMVQGSVARRLVMWPLVASSAEGAPADGDPLALVADAENADGDAVYPAIEIDRGVMPWPLLPDPRGEKVVYATERAVMVLHVAARRAVLVGELAEGVRVSAVQWSPAGDGLAYVTFDGRQLTAYYASPGGEKAAIPFFSVPYGLELDVAWMRNGLPVATTVMLSPMGGLEPRHEYYNPLLEIVLPLPADIDLEQPYSPWISPDGERHVYSQFSWRDTQFRGACRTGPLAISDERWMVTAPGEKTVQVAFSLSGLFLDWATWLPDGRILFRALDTGTCETTGSGLYIGMPQSSPVATPQRLVPSDKVMDEDSYTGYWGLSYALSPDGRWVAWSHNDADAARSTIFLTPLYADGVAALAATGQGAATEPLYSYGMGADAPPDAPAFSFADDYALMHFIWLP